MRAGFRSVVLLVAVATSACSDDRGTEAIGQVSDAAVVCGVGPTVPGIDVSYYQGKPDWQAVAASGQRFAITRIGDGTFMDPEFDSNYEQIREFGMVRGTYQFFRSGKDPIVLAELALGKMGELGPGDLSPVLDVEDADDATPEVMAEKVLAWVKHVETATGRKPIIYTGYYFWKDFVKTTALAEYPLWHAQYTVAECPNIPDAWKNWAIWQYSSMGSVSGISGNVDVNRLNGGELKLQDMAANGYRASVVSFDYPKSLEVGETGKATLVLKNEGARSWGTNTRLGTTEPRDHASALVAPSWLDATRVLALDGEVKSGGTVTITFDVTAPAEAGTVTEHVNLVEEGVAWFSDLVPGGGPKDDVLELTIEVVPATTGSTSGAGGGSGASSSSAATGGVVGGIPDRGASASASCSVTSLRGEPSGRSRAWLALLLLPWLRRRRRVCMITTSWP
jgi:lysozyme